MRFNSLKVSLLVLLLSFSLSAAAENVPDEQFSPQKRDFANSDEIGVFFEENVDTLRMPTILFSYGTSTGRMSVENICSGLDDPKCSEALFLRYYALLRNCISDTDVDCIENLYAILPGTDARIKGVFQKSLPAVTANPYKADPKNGVPQGATSTLWKIPNVSHKGGTDDYVVIVSRVGSVRKIKNGYESFSESAWPGGDFRAAIYPVTEVMDPEYKENVATLHKYPGGRTSVGVEHLGSKDFSVCAVVSDGECALRQGLDYKLTNYGTRIEMQGLPTKVPTVAGWVKPADLSSAQKKMLGEVVLDFGNTSTPGSEGIGSINTLNVWSKILKDKAQAMPSQWIFYNLGEQQMSGANKCILDSKTLAGFVTTNSTTYSAGPPIFNRSTGTLDYKVASLHLMPDGKVFKGSYDLYIDKNVARCIYNFSSAPISASISILNENGEIVLPSTSLTEVKNWIHLSAKDFTFSSPTLRVKLRQAKAIAKSGSKTISCSKGAVTKKVSAVAPKCPIGYKKK
ncbi:MAG: hypothetical protein NTV47_00850 [Actinobacteria bacterium]|nr:hypothetical protein [Actinomycetota bacterium]